MVSVRTWTALLLPLWVFLVARPARAEHKGEEAAESGEERLEANAGDVILSAERLLSIGAYAERGGGEQVTFGYGPVWAPMTFQEVPRLALDVAITQRVTIGAAPIFRLNQSNVGLGLAPRIGYVLPLSHHTSLWPRVGATVAYDSGGTPFYNGTAYTNLAASRAPGVQVAANVEAELVYALLAHAGISLAVAFAAPLTSGAAFVPANQVSALYIGFSGGLVAWF